jgi:hypothetical protein
MHVWMYVFNHQCKSLLDINLNLSFVLFCFVLLFNLGVGRGGFFISLKSCSYEGKKKQPKTWVTTNHQSKVVSKFFKIRFFWGVSLLSLFLVKHYIK